MLVMAVWSVSAMGHALASTALEFVIARFTLGLGEAGNFPAAVKTVAEWFPKSERSLATGLFNSGTNVGAILAPLIVPWVTVRYGWHVAFLATGILGLFWIPWWFRQYRRPADHPKLSSDELRHIYRDAAAETGPSTPWGRLLRCRQTWAFAIAKFFTDPIWYFYLFWIPGYMQEKVGLSLTELGAVGWIPSAVAAVVGIISARWTDRAAARSADPSGVRVRFLIWLSSLAPLGLLINSASSLPEIIALFCVVYTIAQLWFFYTAVLLADIFPAKAIAGALGLLAAVGATVAMLVNLGIGPLVERVGYAPVFVFAAILHPIGAVVQWHFFKLSRKNPFFDFPRPSC